MNANRHTDFDISTEMAENAAPKLTHDEMLERLADVHRTKAHNASQRMADIRRGMKADQASFRADEKEEVARHAKAVADEAANHAEIMASLAKYSAAAKAHGELLLTGEKRLASYNQKSERAALDALAE